MFIPKKLFFTRGVGRDRDELQSFELALRDARIEHVNLVTVSSIFPPHCKVIGRDEGLKLLLPGQIVYAVISRLTTNEPHRLIAAAVGAAIPADPSSYGYLSEFHSFGETDEKAGEHAEDVAAQMLTTTLGIAFDANKDWDELRQEFKVSGKIVKTRNITHSAEGDKHGLYTTVLAAAVFCEQAVDGFAAHKAEMSSVTARIEARRWSSAG